MTDRAATLTIAQSRAVDRYAVEVLGLPMAVLMENAAVNAAAVVLDVLEDAVELDRDRFRVAVVCGSGNNAGDGYAVARHLAGFGIEVQVFAARPVADLSGAALMNAQVCERLGLSIVSDLDTAAAWWASAHVVVDALAGTGLRGALREPLAAAARAVNAAAALESGEVGGRRGPVVVSLDVPSGLDADSGEAAGDAVRAGVTVSFVEAKAGFAGAEAHTGRVVVADIGIPEAAVRAALAAAAAQAAAPD